MAAPLRVGIAGLGTVGASVVRLIERQRDALATVCGRPIEVVAVSARSRAKKRDVDLRKLRWVADPVALATDGEIDVFVELIGGEGDPAKAAISAALAAKKSVVTANKALLARHGVALAAAAEKNQVALNFEAAVGGAIPIVKTLREGLAGNSIARIYGILNGTCNYILSRMEQEKLAFADCLKEAQRLGYAEADPSFDIEGHDTAQKLAILASLAFGTKVDEAAVYVEGISSIASEDLQWADELGYRVKLARCRGQDRQGHRAARASDHGAEGHRDRAGDGRHQRGHRRCRRDRADHPGRPRRRRHGDRRGRRFGSSATSPAACAPRRSAGRRRGSPRSKKAPMQRHEGGYYIRLLARDRPGTAATIAKRLAQQNISLESIVQRHRDRAPAGRRRSQARRRAGAGDPHHLRDQRGCRAQGARRRRPRQGDLGQAAGHPHREKLI